MATAQPELLQEPVHRQDGVNVGAGADQLGGVRIGRLQVLTQHDRLDAAAREHADAARHVHRGIGEEVVAPLLLALHERRDHVGVAAAHA